MPRHISYYVCPDILVRYIWGNSYLELQKVVQARQEERDEKQCVIITF